MSNETAAKYDIIHCSQQVRADNLTTCYRKKKLMSVFHASNLLLIMNCQSSLRIHSAVASWITAKSLSLLIRTGCSFFFAHCCLAS